MLAQARDFFQWIPNAHIKFPTTAAGLMAGGVAVKEGVRVNMTLCFSQAQAAAVHAATLGAARGQVFLSPFVGRLDDIGQNGMDLIANILRMYADGDHHVEVLAASVRTLPHFLEALRLSSDIVTLPLSVLRQWKETGMRVPDASYRYDARGLTPLPYETIDLTADWREYTIEHGLTDKGVKKFSDDWNALVIHHQ